jgi:hypothetical protein
MTGIKTPSFLACEMAGSSVAACPLGVALLVAGRQRNTNWWAKYFA